MNNKEEYKKALDEIKASEELKRKTMYKVKEKKAIKFPYKLANAMAVVVVLFGIVFILDSSKVENIIQPIDMQVAKKEINLPTVGNVENLKKILNKKNEGAVATKFAYEESLSDDMTFNSNLTSATRTESESSKSYSKTNVQVDGVDEADIVKTDGEYIYYISSTKLVITKVGNNMQVVSEVEYVDNDDIRVTPTEMYIDGNKLVMIANKYEKESRNTSSSEQINGDFYRDCISVLQRNYKTMAITYDITDKANPVVYKQFEIEGNYVSSRMVNSNVYLITNKNINVYKDIDLKEEDVVQRYNDTTKPADKCVIELSDVYYIPDSEDNCYMNIISFDTQTKREAEIATILGAGSNVYATDSSIYVMNFKYEFNEGDLIGYQKTKIYKFNIDKRNISYVAQGEVYGNVLNQFSVDEYDGNFRIATTDSRNGKNISSLYILDSNLKMVSKLENLAENERVYAVRFMGDKGYIVTFRQTDPLFVMDLSDASEPKILGELKIPGYSSYLHPYDKNHIIGIGQDVEIKTDRYGFEYTKQNGLKLSMFDVSDPANPIEMFNTIIGDGGTYTAAEYNHKTLLFVPDKNLLAFPILVNKAIDSKTSKVVLDFQGVMVLNVDLENGFSERGRIAHMEITNGYDDYDYKQEIERVIYINNDFYTLSPGTIKRTDMNTMQELDKVEIEVQEQEYMWPLID